MYIDLCEYMNIDRDTYIDTYQCVCVCACSMGGKKDQRFPWSQSEGN